MNKVLYVENESELLEMITEYLSFNSWTVFPSPNIKKALEMLQKETFKALLLDYDLGNGETSLEIINYLQKNKLIVPTILYSGEPALVLRKKINYKGLMDIVEKASPDSLQKVLNALNKGLDSTLSF